MTAEARRGTILTRVLAPLSRTGARLTQLTGRRGAFAAFAAGVATALAFAPFYFLPLMLAGYSAFVFLLDGAAEKARPRRAAFVTGWMFGFGFFLVGLYWMAFSFFVQADQFAWMAPFAILGMPAFLGLFTGAAGALAVSFWRNGPSRILVFAAAFMLLEYARGHVLTGLPWNLPGQALAGLAAGAQTAAFYGVYGLSLVAVLIAALPAAWPHRPARGLLAALAGAALLYGAGYARLAAPGPGVHDDVMVRVVQPNIPQREKIDWDLWGRNFRRHLDLSKGETPPGARLFVIWPENAAPLLTEAEGVMERLAEELPRNSTLIAGAVRRQTDEAGKERYYNSVAAVVAAPDGTRFAFDHYDKHHLVPFGEYLPMADVLRAVGLAQLAPFDDGFSFGEGPRTLRAGGPAFAPLVCYEAIFPGEMYPRDDRPEWLVAVTNDAWFGDTSGPRQHLDQARLRAIETGLPMARSANTGISAVIDAHGRYVARVPLYEAGVIDAPLPRAATATFYARLGDWPFAIMLLCCAAAGILARTGARTGA